MQRRFIHLATSSVVAVVSFLALLSINIAQTAAVTPSARLPAADRVQAARFLLQPDTEPPTPPADLAVAHSTQTDLVLTWTAATDGVGVTGYRLYERVRLNPYYWLWILRVTDLQTTTVTLDGLAPGSLHRYAVTAFDAAGNESAKSALLQLYIYQPPQAYHPISQGEHPVAIAGELFQYAVAALGVPAPTFTVTAGPTDMTMDAISGLVTWTPTLSDVGVVTATVRAINIVGSDEHTFTFPVHPAGTDIVPPGAISQLTASDTTTQGTTLNWVAALDNVGVAGYRILAQVAGHGQGLFLAADTGEPVTTFTITTLQPGTSYRLWVAAYDAAGNVASISGLAPLSIATLSGGVDVPINGLLAHNSSPTMVGAPTVFTATIDAGTNASFSWAFGDGSLGTGPLASHIYTATGLYTATITAANSLGEITATTGVIITPLPVSNTNQISLMPPTPTVSDLISITVSGVHINSCTPVYQAHQVQGYLIDMISVPSGETFCIPVETSWAFAIQIGPLAAGQYTVTHIFGASIVDMTTFTVTAILTPSIQLGEVEGQALSGMVGEPFHYQVGASGAPPLEFTLTDAPPGMTIDPASGHVVWTPGEETTAAFSVRVTNNLGGDDYTFQIDIAPAQAMDNFIFVPLIVR